MASIENWILVRSHELCQFLLGLVGRDLVGSEADLFQPFFGCCRDCFFFLVLLGMFSPIYFTEKGLCAPRWIVQQILAVATLGPPKHQGSKRACPLVDHTCLRKVRP